MKHWAFGGLLSLFGILGFHAHATTFVMMTDEEMIQASRAVCFGRITNVRSEQIGNSRSIQTVASFKKTECFKGDSSLPQEFPIVFPGGTAQVRIGNLTRTLTQKVPGTPQLKKDDEGVFHFFWEPHANPSQGVTVTSWERGVIPMKMVDGEYRDLRSIRRPVQPAGDQKNMKQAQVRPRGRTLADIREKVREVETKR